MNLSYVKTKDYRNEPHLRPPAKQTQFKANFTNYFELEISFTPGEAQSTQRNFTQNLYKKFLQFIHKSEKTHKT